MVADPKDTARAFVAELLAALGDRLRSALLYGSVARGEAVSGVSDINLLILVDRVDAGLLRVGSPLARRWAKAGNTAPLLMPWDEWRRASDVFAVELADMKDAHVLLQGPDPLDGLVVDARALRLQAEREIRGKMLQLREGLLLTAEKPEEVGRLLLTSLPSFATYLRAVLRLSGRTPPARTEATVRDAAELVGGDPAAFLRLWEARVRRHPLRAQVDHPSVTGYYALIERVADYVDQLPEAEKK